MGKHIIEGHEIDLADADDLDGFAGKPISMTFGDGGKISASVPTHPTKSILAKFALESENLPKDEYWLLVPPAANRTQLGLSEIRPVRNQWTSNDIGHQIELFDAIGRIAVFGGHVEMAMKKVLITLRGGDHDLLDPTLPGDWDGLDKELRKVCDGSDQTRIDLLQILDDAESAQLRDKRNDAIHGYWWLVRAHNRLINARYYRPKKGTTPLPISIYNTIEDVRAVSTALYHMADKLEKLVTPHWPIAFFDDVVKQPKKDRSG
ncbi:MULTISPECIES: hypothetical protein [Mycolicibacterium]|uniref:ApeA N-terminal domain-containing protein n=1 Tax=Mycolicibacterium senegalense TaxID=1796 RepID=A0ABR5FN43_9MYCO|nr:MULTISPECIES: hypothetical protein [Mycolicibacterium]KLI07887.1 hypothetical protein AA982_12290 [Mycolicibacterium senegalense]KLO48251.1 hypothetical protein ABW05_26445 [Mycolicibacterium senegalense]OBJ97105.1 hypothetical protein A5639_30765 [Mycolicibacterium conceptionense]OMB68206.1 hypothetical protein A5741_09980 [Mycolicibacterium conceptionense]OMB88585.1 hypothetical protein A5746_24210 [Mycolicibacterium conceptionense]